MFRLCRGGERDKPGAVGEFGLELARHLERQPRLAHAAGAGERRKTDVGAAEQPRHGVAVTVAANRARRRLRQPARRPGRPRPQGDSVRVALRPQLDRVHRRRRQRRVLRQYGPLELS